MPTIPNPTTTIFLRWAGVAGTFPSASAPFGVALMAMPGDEVAHDIFDKVSQKQFDGDDQGANWQVTQMILHHCISSR